ncbi:retrovirus-related Pol polyprotein from transposon 17.6 [Trichonephila clavipes]|nr:retrovirus-related Pol polyprotein from transposon 17.6 [Trichonephila clavipes]
MLPGSSTSLTALFHGCESHLKLLECVVDGTGEVVLEVRRLQKTDISSYQQKGTGALQLSRWKISFLLPQESRSPEKLLPDNVKLNQIANDERTGLSPLQTETSVISALTSRLKEINLRVERVPESSSVTARKTGNEFRRQIADLEKAGIISKSNSQYNTPALFVKQREKWRLVLDFRKLNEITLTQDFVIPTLDDILHEISGSNYFSALDMKSAFNQIPLHFADRHKTAFSTPDGDKYEFNRLCFGLKNSPTAFQSIAQEVLGDLLHTELWFI